jgi:hypothetical protein
LESSDSHRQGAFFFFTRSTMVKSRSWARLAAHGLGLFNLLQAVSVLPNTDSAKALVAADGQTGDPDYTSSADKPCALGCCNQNGICGMGPDFCSPENCVNSCDAKSECDPSNWGPQYAANEKCPLNVRFALKHRRAPKKREIHRMREEWN